MVFFYQCSNYDGLRRVKKMHRKIKVIEMRSRIRIYRGIDSWKMFYETRPAWNKKKQMGILRTYVNIL